MNVIRDENQTGKDTPVTSMVPLLVSWGIKRCNIKGCENKPTTIVTNTVAPVFGMCEHHYQEAASTDGKYKLHLEFDLQ